MTDTQHAQPTPTPPLDNAGAAAPGHDPSGSPAPAAGARESSHQKPGKRPSTSAAKAPGEVTTPTPDDIAALVQASDYVHLAEILQPFEGPERVHVITRFHEEVAAGHLLAVPLDAQIDGPQGRKVPDELVLNTPSLRHFREHIGIEYRIMLIAEGKPSTFSLEEAQHHFQHIAQLRIKSKTKPRPAARPAGKAEKKAAAN